MSLPLVLEAKNRDNNSNIGNVVLETWKTELNRVNSQKSSDRRRKKEKSEGAKERNGKKERREFHWNCLNSTAVNSIDLTLTPFNINSARKPIHCSIGQLIWNIKNILFMSKLFTTHFKTCHNFPLWFRWKIFGEHVLNTPVHANDHNRHRCCCCCCYCYCFSCCCCCWSDTNLEYANQAALIQYKWPHCVNKQSEIGSCVFFSFSLRSEKISTRVNGIRREFSA